MTKIVLDISVSLDGFVAGPNVRADEPLGDGGERLHEWAFGADERDRRILADAGAATGAVIAGRRTYDMSLRWWGADGPTGPARLPLFVVTHDAPDDAPEGGVYEFVTDGIEAALERARAAAGGRTVCVMGGAAVAQQYLGAGLVDEISLHVVPILLGGGIRLFDDGMGGPLELEPLETISTPKATHARYRILEVDR